MPWAGFADTPALCMIEGNRARMVGRKELNYSPYEIPPLRTPVPATSAVRYNHRWMHDL